MSKTISSSMTVIYKFIFPSVWIGGFGVGTIAMFSCGEPDKGMFLAIWILGSLYLAWSFIPLKHVAIDGDDLVISNFLKSVRVPAAHIHNVTENGMINKHPVWIHFKTPTPFGPKVMFIPTGNVRIFRSHPVVAELMELARQERSQSGRRGHR